MKYTKYDYLFLLLLVLSILYSSFVFTLEGTTTLDLGSLNTYENVIVWNHLLLARKKNSLIGDFIKKNGLEGNSKFIEIKLYQRERLELFSKILISMYEEKDLNIVEVEEFIIEVRLIFETSAKYNSSFRDSFSNLFKKLLEKDSFDYNYYSR